MNLRKLIPVIGITALSCAPVKISPIPLKNYVEKNPQAYVDKLKTEFELTFPGEPDLPRMSYTELKNEHLAEYNNNEVTFDPRRNRYPIKKEKSVTNTDNTIYHELVHFNNDKLRRKYRLPWHGNSAGRLVEEGTAEFIANSMTGYVNRCYYFRNLTETDYKKTRTVYDVGSCIVGPVIEKYKEPGIVYMFANVPTEEEVKDPYRYRDRMLKELDAGNRVKEPPDHLECKIPFIAPFELK